MLIAHGLGLRGSWLVVFCPGQEAALVIIVSAAADPLYVIPMWIFDCVTGKRRALILNVALKMSNAVILKELS